MRAMHRALPSLLVILIAVCGGTSSAPPTPSATAVAAMSSPTPARTPRASFPSVTTSAGVVWAATDEPPGPPIDGVKWWAKGTWPDGYTTVAAVYAPPGDGPFPAVVYLHEARGLTEAQLDAVRKIAAGGFIVVAGCELSLARVQCRRRFDLFETEAAIIEFARGLPNARGDATALIGASAAGSTVLYTATKRKDISAVVADSGVGLDYPTVPVLLLASRADSLLANTVAVDQAYEAELRARGGIVESHYYDTGGHIVLVDPQTTEDAIQRVIAFLNKYITR